MQKHAARLAATRKATEVAAREKSGGSLGPSLQTDWMMQHLELWLGLLRVQTSCQEDMASVASAAGLHQQVKKSPMKNCKLQGTETLAADRRNGDQLH